MIGNLHYVFESLLFIRFLTAEKTLTSSCKCAFAASVVHSLSFNSFICCLSALLSSTSANFCVRREYKNVLLVCIVQIHSVGDNVMGYVLWFVAWDIYSFVNLAYLQWLGQQPKWLLIVFSIDQLLPASADSSRACARLCRTVVIHKYLLLYVNDRHLLTMPHSRLLCIGGKKCTVCACFSSPGIFFEILLSLLHYTNLYKACRLLLYKRCLPLTILCVDNDEGTTKKLFACSNCRCIRPLNLITYRLAHDKKNHGVTLNLDFNPCITRFNFTTKFLTSMHSVSIQQVKGKENK